MTNARVVVRVWVFGAVVATGCGGTTNEGSGGPAGTYTPPPVHGTPVAQVDFAREVAQQGCPAIAACCHKYGFGSDENTCLTNAQTSVQQGVFGTVNTNHVRYDANAAGDCVAQLVNYFRTCSAAQPNTPACGHVLVGLVPEGGACTESGECADPPSGYSYCDKGQCRAETNAAGTPGVLGDPCNATCTTTGTSIACGTSIAPNGGPTPPANAKSCETTSGLYCNGNTGQCAAVAKLGEACTSYCAAGAYCDGGICVAQKSSGECRSSSACNASTFCDYTQSPSQCVPKRQEGATCQGSSECASDRCENNVCVRDAPVDAQSCSGVFD